MVSAYGPTQKLPDQPRSPLIEIGHDSRSQVVDRCGDIELSRTDVGRSLRKEAQRNHPLGYKVRIAERATLKANRRSRDIAASP